MSKVNFDMDWDHLFPGKMFKVEKMSHHVKPLTIKGIASITRKIKSIIPVLKENGFDLGDLASIKEEEVPGIIVNAVPILMETAPEIISEATGIEVDSLMQFPPQYLIELVTVAVEANLESKEALEKNFRSLMGMFQKKNQKKQMD